MSPNPESGKGKPSKTMEDRLKQIDLFCICSDCPTYAGLGKNDAYISYCFRGRSKKITGEVGCQCPDYCPVWKENKFTKQYFCTRGTEQQQKKGKT
nr:DUF2769 domain-containing protein [Candidatus Freyarchaeota archaeon]